MLFILLIYFILIKAPTKLNSIFLSEQNRVLTELPISTPPYLPPVTSSFHLPNLEID